MLYQESQRLIAEGEELLRSGKAGEAQAAFRQAGELQWQFVETRAPGQVRTRSVFGLSAATLYYRAQEPKRAEQIATYLLSQGWLENYCREKLRALMDQLRNGSHPVAPDSSSEALAPNGCQPADNSSVPEPSLN